MAILEQKTTRVFYMGWYGSCPETNENKCEPYDLVTGELANAIHTSDIIDSVVLITASHGGDQKYNGNTLPGMPTFFNQLKKLECGKAYRIMLKAASSEQEIKSINIPEFIHATSETPDEYRLTDECIVYESPTPTPTPVYYDYEFVYGVRENKTGGISSNAKWLIKDRCSVDIFPYIKNGSYYTIYPNKQLETGEETGHIDWFAILDVNSGATEENVTLSFLEPENSECVVDIVNSEIKTISTSITSGKFEWDEWYIELDNDSEFEKDGNGYVVQIGTELYTLYYWSAWLLRTNEVNPKPINSGPTTGNIFYDLGTEITTQKLPSVGENVILSKPGKGNKYEVIYVNEASFIIREKIYGLENTKLAFENCGEKTSFVFNLSDNFQDYDKWKYWESKDAPYLTNVNDEHHANDPRFILHSVTLKYTKFDELLDLGDSDIQPSYTSTFLDE